MELSDDDPKVLQFIVDNETALIGSPFEPDKNSDDDIYFNA